jgi:hypothetical protein
MSINQAVIFTKPVPYLGIELTPKRLDELAQEFFKLKGFKFILSKKVTGPELAARNVIQQHYRMYSKAACAESVDDLNVSDDGKAAFEKAFGKSWDDEAAAGRLITTADLLESKGIDVHQLFDLWNGLFASGKTAKVQDGLIMGYLEKQEAYCMNAFYPSMEANLYEPAAEIHYYVVEFDPEQVSWKQFRKHVLGSTNASNAAPESFRGQLYSDYPVEYPGRDNFVHGSAGAVEGFVERSIHEPDFKAETNPVGRYLAGRGVSLEHFIGWKNSLTISELGDLFDATEEINTDEALKYLDSVDFS